MTQRLIFGDPESIKLRDNAFKENIFNKLKEKVKCPFCGAKVSHYYEFNLRDKTIGLNFDCLSDCPNSIDYAEENGYEESQTIFNFLGKLICE